MSGCLQLYAQLDCIVGGGATTIHGCYHQYVKILTCVCVSVSDGSGMFVGRD